MNVCRLPATFSHPEAQQPRARSIELFTAREKVVLTAVARGWTNSEIAEELYISLSTVKSHVASLMRRLDARGRVEMAMWADGTDRLPG